MNDFTFLDKDQVFGDNQLDILKKYGTRCSITDFSTLLGAEASLGRHISPKNSINDHTGWWWTKSIDDDYGEALTVCDDGSESRRTIEVRYGGARPALPYSSIVGLCSNRMRKVNGILELEYGEYPQTVVSENFSESLERAYLNGTINKTGKSYTTDSVKFHHHETPFQARTHIEYEYNGKKYIRFVGDLNCRGEELSDDRIIYMGSPYWVEVEPIKWMIDEKTDIALCKKIIFSGVQFDRDDSCNSDFEDTDIKKFMDTYFSKDIIPSHTITKVDESKLVNPYEFDYENVSEEKIIKGAVESDVAVFLHGRSGDGKSDRVRELDKNAEIIYLRNATPDSLNGKSVFNSSTGEMIDIPPTWYKRLVEKCEKEPDKIHILFFDELTNALPSIQGMAFNIVLNKEVDGKWKLPENARIVAAGNDLEESRAANELAQPLFNRFAHVYIKTTVEDWLKWASTPDEEYKKLEYTSDTLPSKIHPSIYAYIAYKSYSKQDVLRTPYNGKVPNADPRKWEMASKVLYRTKRPEMLRALVGEALTKDFIAFTSTQVLSVEDVISGNYDESILEMNVSQKYSTAVGLSSVSIEHIEIVRDFVKRLGPEVCAMFDTLWTRGDESRLEKIAELKMSDRTK